VSRLSLGTVVALPIACASLPNVEDFLHTDRATRPPTLVSAEGLLPPAATRRVMARLEGDVGPTDILRKHLADVEAITERPLFTGNAVRVLQDGPATYDAIFAAIERARDHINMETYIFEDDRVGRRMADLLLRKQREGVQVNIIYDSFGSLETSQGFFDRLRNGGVNTVEFNPVSPLNAKRRWILNQRDHRKILVVDGTVAFTGGLNISQVYSRSSFGSGRSGRSEPADRFWRDTHVQIEGPVVAEFQRIFLEAWSQQHGPPLPKKRYFPPLDAKGNLIVQAINSSPATGQATIYQAFMSAINHAEQSIHLTAAYFAPDSRMLQALVRAAARGVDVKLLLPSVTDAGLILQAGQSHYGTLLKGGVKIYERQGAILHAKTAVVDGVWSTIGSANLDWRSFLHNEEINAVILGEEFARHMEVVFQHDLAASRRVSFDAWNTRPLLQRMKETAARFIEYWL
jgi:cardiolipin synthase